MEIKKLDKRPDQVGTEDALRGHNLALKLHEHGFRVNFTLMFEPFQTMLAMQARPYFINTFLRHRLLQSQNIKKYVDMYEVSKDNKILETLKDTLSPVIIIQKQIGICIGRCSCIW